MQDDLLTKLVKIEQDAFEFGFYWENAAQLFDQIKSECDEIEEAVSLNDNKHLKEEMGDLMSAVISLCIFYKLDPYETLKDNIEKFQKRYQILLALVKKQGLNNLKNQPMSVLLDFWNQAKKHADENDKNNIDQEIFT